jgi:hypothetical protein
MGKTTSGTTTSGTGTAPAKPKKKRKPAAKKPVRRRRMSGTTKNSSMVVNALSVAGGAVAGQVAIETMRPDDGKNTIGPLVTAAAGIGCQFVKTDWVNMLGYGLLASAVVEIARPQVQEWSAKMQAEKDADKNTKTANPDGSLMGSSTNRYYFPEAGQMKQISGTQILAGGPQMLAGCGCQDLSGNSTTSYGFVPNFQPRMIAEDTGLIAGTEFEDYNPETGQPLVSPTYNRTVYRDDSGLIF